MRCKKHVTDLTSLAGGVCATCLRDRLSAIAAAQIQLNQSQPSISFPRSVSPYISCRKSDTVRLQFHPRFYSTPQLNSKKSNRSFSSLIQGIFRSKSEQSDPNSSSWFSNVIRKKQFRSLSQSTTKTRRNNLNRGMSPARYSDEDENYHGGFSGYSSECSKQTPRSAIRRGKGHNRSLSGLAFCLSPLVRPSPNRQRIPPENGESRVPAKSSLSTAASFCKSRSRKLADYGRHYYSTNY